jgi:hypothetical protein
VSTNRAEGLGATELQEEQPKRSAKALFHRGELVLRIVALLRCVTVPDAPCHVISEKKDNQNDLRRTDGILTEGERVGHADTSSVTRLLEKSCLKRFVIRIAKVAQPNTDEAKALLWSEVYTLA